MTTNNQDSNQDSNQDDTNQHDVFAAFEVKAHMTLGAIHAMPIAARQALKCYDDYDDGPVASLQEFAAWAADQLGAGSVCVDDIAFVTAWWVYSYWWSYCFEGHCDKLQDALAAIANAYLPVN